MKIDVAARYQDIRRIVLKHFNVAGVHPDDLVQDVVLRVLENNSLPCAFNPSRSSFSHYVYIVARSVAAKAANREARQSKARAAMRDELFPSSGQRMKVGADSGPAMSAPIGPVEWVASIEGLGMQLSLFAWEPIDVARLVPKLPVRASSSRTLGQITRRHPRRRRAGDAQSPR